MNRFWKCLDANFPGIRPGFGHQVWSPSLVGQGPVAKSPAWSEASKNNWDIRHHKNGGLSHQQVESSSGDPPQKKITVFLKEISSSSSNLTSRLKTRIFDAWLVFSILGAGIAAMTGARSVKISGSISPGVCSATPGARVCLSLAKLHFCHVCSWTACKALFQSRLILKPRENDFWANLAIHLSSLTFVKVSRMNLWSPKFSRILNVGHGSRHCRISGVECT